jgi:hypothetical protein
MTFLMKKNFNLGLLSIKIISKKKLRGIYWMKTRSSSSQHTRLFDITTANTKCIGQLDDFNQLKCEYARSDGEMDILEETELATQFNEHSFQHKESKFEFDQRFFDGDKDSQQLENLSDALHLEIFSLENTEWKEEEKDRISSSNFVTSNGVTFAA